MSGEAPVPLPASRSIGLNPGIGRAMGAIWHLVWKTRLISRRLLKMAVLLVPLPLIASLVSSPQDPGSYLTIVVKFHLGLVVPVVCLLNMASPVREENEQGTLSYLATRPLPRHLLFLLLHACHLLWLEIVFLVVGLLLLAVGFRMEIPAISAMIVPFLLAQAGTVLAFSGLSALAGLLTRRYLLLGLLYGAIIEVGVGGIPTNINAFSMSHHVRVIISIFEPAAAILRANEGDPVISLVCLTAVGAITAMLAALIYRGREFAGGPDS